MNGMFASHYRSAHEAARPEVVDMMIERFGGRPATQVDIDRLRKRDRSLRLEMDSFCMLAMFSAELAATFPTARFLLTVREPRPWLNSIMNQHLNVDVSQRPADGLLRQLLYRPPGSSYSSGEEELERRGLFPLDGYLGGWCTHYMWVLDAVPRGRLLVIRTEELGSSIGRVASFLGIPSGSIDRNRTHLHSAPRDHGVIGLLPPSLVEEKIAAHCTEVLSRVSALMGDAEENQANERGVL